MKLLLSLLAGNFLVSPALIQYEHINENIVLTEKTDISKFKIKKESIYVKEQEEDLRTYVYLEMMNKYPEYGGFFIDLIINRNQYLVAGDSFIFPEDPNGIGYNITVVALSTNTSYIGKLQFTIRLLLEFERIDLSKYNNLFNKQDLKTYAKIKVERNNIASILELTRKEVLQAIDSHLRIMGIKEWSRDPNLLENDINNIDIRISEPHITKGYTEGYYEVLITPRENSEWFLPYSLTAYIHGTFNYKRLSKNINHNIGIKIGASWSKVNKWYWENNGIWFTALNLEDYLTHEEKEASNYDYLKAFTKKYEKMKFIYQDME